MALPVGNAFLCRAVNGGTASLIRGSLALEKGSARAAENPKQQTEDNRNNRNHRNHRNPRTLAALSILDTNPGNPTLLKSFFNQK
jgi:hypothetical protein